MSATPAAASKVVGLDRRCHRRGIVHVGVRSCLFDGVPGRNPAARDLSAVVFAPGTDSDADGASRGLRWSGPPSGDAVHRRTDSSERAEAIRHADSNCNMRNEKL